MLFRGQSQAKQGVFLGLILWAGGQFAFQALLSPIAYAAIEGDQTEILKTLDELKTSPDPRRFKDIAELLLVNDPIVIENARAALTRIPDWRQAATQLARSRVADERFVALNTLICDTGNMQLGQNFALLLADPIARIRSRAAGLVELWAASPAIESIRSVLIGQFKSEKEAVARYTLLFSIAQLATPASLEVFVKASSDADPQIREVAIHGLGNLTAKANSAKEPAMKRLMRISETGDERERVVAFYYVGRSGGESGRKLLEKIAVSKGSPSVRSAALQATHPPTSGSSP